MKNLIVTENVDNRSIFDGNSDHVLRLNDAEHKWAIQMYKQALESFWIPEKTDVTGDVNTYNELTSDEKEVYNQILSYLIFLDSSQQNILPIIANKISNPEIKSLISVHTTMEAIHSASYSYLVESLLPTDKRDDLYYYWKTNELVNTRCKQITDAYQEYLDKPTEENFALMLLGDFILEGIAFYAGFYYFHALASRALMAGTNDLINLIKRDEVLHYSLFSKLIRDCIDKGLISEEVVLEQLSIAKTQEIEFWSKLLENKVILGFRIETVIEFISYLFGNRAKSIGINFPLSAPKNPFKHLDTQNDFNKDSIKANFFDSNSNTYSMASQLDGWGDI